MKTIWKFPIAVTDEQPVSMPHNALILSAQMQGDTPCLWAFVDEEAPMEDRMVFVRGTGHPIGRASTAASFVDTIQTRGLVFHVFAGWPRLRASSEAEEAGARES